MTIKKKLFINMLLTVTGFILIAGFSLVGMKFVQRNITALTERSTPYQLKMVELQRALQEHTANLLKVTSSASLDDFNTAKAESEKTIGEAKKVSGELDAFKSGITGQTDIGELLRITDDIVKVTQDRLKAEEETKTASSITMAKHNDIAKKLRDMDSSIKKLQNGSLDQLSSSNESVKKITKKLKNVQLVVYSIKDLKQAISDIAASNSKSELTVAQSRFNSSMRWITQSELVKTEKESSAVKEILDGLSDISKYVAGEGGLIALKDSILKNPDDETKNKLMGTRAIINQKLAQMTTISGDIDEKSSENFSDENKKLDSSLNESTTSSNILAMNNELVAAGFEINDLINEAFFAKTLSELDRLSSEMKVKFNNADAIGRKLTDALLSLKKNDEVKLIRSTMQSLSEIKGLILSENGIIKQLQNVLAINEQVTGLNAKLKDVVTSQREQGKQGVTAAQEEQENTVITVNKAVKSYVIGIAVIVIIVLGLGMSLSKLLANSIISPIDELVTLAEGFGNGNFSRKMNGSRKDEFGKVALHFNNASGNLNNIISDIATTINDLAMRSIILQSSAEVINKGSQEQTLQTEQSATAMTQMSHSISDVAKNALNTSKSSNETAELARKGKESVDRTVQGMLNISGAVKEASALAVSLGESSKEIGKVVDVINEIAAQINLLALNAAIEAARAGDYGRGFAVVADEVRHLSEKTVGSTQAIAGVIKNIQNAVSKSISAMKHGEEEVESGMKIAENASASLNQIVAASDKEADMIHTIAAASEEQSSVSEQVTGSMEAITRITREMNNSISDIKKTSDELYNDAEKLSTAASWFKRG
ncbi:MAG: methyl-accepting chemotaxis protein [Nitrospirae bacterium]|nr:methyl-accepting chemotaxis protein [Nitrospirota bacterium]